VASFLVALLIIGSATFLTAGDDEEKSSSRGFLGVSVEKMSADDRAEFGVQFGVLVMRVSEDEAAEKAGIKRYDVIQYFNGTKIRRPIDLTEAVSNSKPGSNATIKMVRDGSQKTVTAKLGERKGYAFFGDKNFNVEGLHPKVFRFHGDDLKGKDFKWKGKNFNFRVPGKDGEFHFKGMSGGYLGVNLGNLSEEMAAYFGVKKDGGAWVTKVEEDSPADKAGIKDGDVITKVDGKDVNGSKDLVKILAKMEKGDKVSIELTRHKKKQTIKAELGERKGLHNIRIFGDGNDFHFGGDHEVIVAPGSDDERHIIIERKLRDKEKKEKKEEKKKGHHIMKKLEESGVKTMSI
jgi:predicted metalloprotease with PDZ domain